MDFINEKELYDKVVQPAVDGLAKAITVAISQIRNDLDGTILTIKIPATSFEIHLNLPKEREK